jgi:lipid-binding SYLF domain-containing protein
MKYVIALAALFCLALLADPSTETQKRLEESGIVLEEIMGTRENEIPHSLLSKAECAVVIPGLKKGAFIVGGQYGRGFVTCRKKAGTGWSAPGAVRMEGGSFGFQIGGSEIDVVMLVMNQRGAERLLASKFTLGGDASVAAGPVGRTAKAETDATMRAEILSWSRSRGVFAGISLQGATLRQDGSVNKEMYGEKFEESKAIVGSDLDAPKAAEKLLAQLSKHASRK